MAGALVAEIHQNCLLTRTRQISRVITGIYDREFRDFGINSPQLTLIVMVSRLGPVSRAEIGRHNFQERSTLTRNLQLLLSEGWLEEVPKSSRGRGRLLVVTELGKDLLKQVAPSWRRAQKQAKAILGHAGAAAVIDVANELSVQAT
jgi:DNA-binding MarR family transcriptional regulator